MEKQIVEFLKNDWQQRHNDFMDTDVLIAKFTDGQAVRDVLSNLQARGYIKVTYADDTIYTISVSSKFKDEFS